MNTEFVSSPESASVLARAEVEALLPDYAFGTLASADEKARFEAALPLYPDLAQELRLIQESFDGVSAEFEALDRAQSQRLKNLSVHVQERIQHDLERRAHWFRLMKFFVPALAMCVILAVISIPQAFQADWMTFSSGRNNESAILTPADIERLANLEIDASALENNAFGDNLVAAPNAADDDKTAAMVARRMLDKETLRAIAANRSAFQDYFDNSAILDNISDEDAATLAAAITEM